MFHRKGSERLHYQQANFQVFTFILRVGTQTHADIPRLTVLHISYRTTFKQFYIYIMYLCERSGPLLMQHKRPGDVSQLKPKYGAVNTLIKVCVVCS
jgi:hypothetical protein